MSQTLSDIKIEEINLEKLNITEEAKTEQAYLEMADHFKELMSNKNELIKDLKKAVMVLYGIIRTADENHDPEMLVQARQVASEYIDYFFFPDDD
jgi:hypothetical protein